jgi:hypothetical protein
VTNAQRTLVGVVGILALAAVRMVVLYDPSAPAGIDGGNWLAFGTFTRPGLVYPPAVPIAFAALVAVTGPIWGSAIAGALSAAAPALAVLGVLAWAGRPTAGTLAGLAIVGSGAVGEIVAWGGYPQPIALAAALVMLVACATWLATGSRAVLVVFAVAAALTVATSHLVAVPAAVAVGFLGIRALFLRPRHPARIAVAAAVIVVPFIVLAPTYIALFGTLSLPGVSSSGDIDRILGIAWPIYLAALVVVSAAAVVALIRSDIRRRAAADDGAEAGAADGALGERDSILLAAAGSAAVSWFLAYVISGEPRLLHDIGTIAVFSIAVLSGPFIVLARRRKLDFAVQVAAVAAVMWVAAAGIAAFPDQVHYYHVLTQGAFSAIDYVAEHPLAPGTKVLVADSRGVPIGWWVEGITKEESLFASDLRWLRFPDERARASTANTLLYASGFPSAESASKIAASNVGAVLLPDASSFGLAPGQAPDGWQILYSSGPSMLLAPAASASLTP